MKLPTISINCDMGEGIGNDAELMPLINWANVACGLHAGNPATMYETALLAHQQGIKIGVHCSYFDLANFGRKELNATPQEVYQLTLYQIGALCAIVQNFGGTLHHVKPHGALYNVSAKNRFVAQAIAQAVYDFDKNLILLGLSGSCSISEAQKIGLQTAQEVFADRTYQNDASLTPRSFPNALIETPEQALAQVQLMQQGQVQTTDGSLIPIHADTVCIHGDSPNAIVFAKILYKSLNCQF